MLPSGFRPDAYPSEGIPQVAPAAKKPAPKKAAKAAPAKKAIPAKAAKTAAVKPVTKTAAKAMTKPAAAKPAATKATATKATAPKAAPAKPVATAVASPPPAPAPKKPRKPAFTPAELEQIRVELTGQREVFARELAELEAGTFNQSQSDLSGEVSFDEESADAGTFTFERERDLSLSNNLRDLLDKVDSALRRIKNGTYGTCERCGRSIDKARLKALPYSVLCIDCKKLEERVR
jgi:RNA polymerase-binding transcription factor